MRLIRNFALALAIGAASVAAHAQCQLVGRGSQSRLMVDGKPFLILGGELGNSSASCPDDIERHFAKLKAMGLNTVLVPTYWDLMEPVEGQFDFSLTDHVIATAAGHDMKVVLLWFGAWKNSMSCYAPAWFKVDTKRFPRSRTAKGKALEIASAFEPNVFEADSRAFEALVKHVTQTDVRHTVIMLQIENEIGMLENARDHSPKALKAYEARVPSRLTDYLAAHADSLHPKLAKMWEANGKQKRSSWAKTFGTDACADEVFQAYFYADYVGRLANIARKYTSMPLYVNAALNSRGRKPGEYPAAGPLAHLIDVWRAAAPSINFFSPDIYDKGFDVWTEQYAASGNPLFIPEMRLGDDNGAQAFYAFGEHAALGVSPFAIETGSVGGKLSKSYEVLSKLTPFFAAHADSARGVLLTQELPEDGWQDGDLDLKFSHFFTLPWDPRARDGSEWPAAGAMVIKLSPREYILAGTGVVLNFASLSETEVAAREASKQLGEDGFALSGGKGEAGNAEQPDWSNVTRVGILSVDDVEPQPDGTLKFIRRLNGDEDHQGRHVRIGVDDVKVLHVKLYDY